MSPPGISSPADVFQSHIVHAMQELPPPPIDAIPGEYLKRYSDGRSEATRMIRRDIGAEELEAQLHIEERVAPADAILAAADGFGCDLIVLGEARDRLFGPVIEGTVEQVVRKSPVMSESLEISRKCL